MKKKVFCGDCMYFTVIDMAGCDHPKNEEDDWYGKNHSHIFRPCEKNCENNCEWFKMGILRESRGIKN